MLAIFVFGDVEVSASSGAVSCTDNLQLILDLGRIRRLPLGTRCALREAEGWIHDGIEFGYFPEDKCRRAFWFGERCFAATLRLKHSQERYAERLRREGRSRSKLEKR